jgi:hypothetical protein
MDIITTTGTANLSITSSPLKGWVQEERYDDLVADVDRINQRLVQEENWRKSMATSYANLLKAVNDTLDDLYSNSVVDDDDAHHFDHLQAWFESGELNYPFETEYKINIDVSQEWTIKMVVKAPSYMSKDDILDYVKGEVEDAEGDVENIPSEIHGDLITVKDMQDTRKSTSVEVW